MVSRFGGRARRLIITGIVAAGLGAGGTGVALASANSTSAAATTTRTTSTSSSQSSSASPSVSSPAGIRRPASGSTGTHHCTHMGSGSATPGSSSATGS